MKIALCQINPTAGDVRGNGLMIFDAAAEAYRRGADLAVFPEMCVTAYPPMDLLDDATFLDAVEWTVSSIAEGAPSDMGVIIGAPTRNMNPAGKRLRNSALLLHGGAVVDQVDKSLLPTYDVYDEYRHFEPARSRRCMQWKGVRLGVHICEDMWNGDEAAPFRLYDADPVADLAADGTDIFINLSATPFSRGNHARRSAAIKGICDRFGRPFVVVNQVGANTELIFDGASAAYGSDGRPLVAAPIFEESIVVWDSDEDNPVAEPERSDLADLHRALILGIRDFARKSGAFAKVVVGLSGGIDSSVTCALAVEALGPGRVLGVSLPARHTSAMSIEDAGRLAGGLGIELLEMPIEAALGAVDAMLAPLIGRLSVAPAEAPPVGADVECPAPVKDGSAFGVQPAEGASAREHSTISSGSLSAGRNGSITGENLQARLRAVVLMAISNEFQHLLLTTGNKSEAAVGYMTLYGDMAGGLAVLQDVYKTQVYELAEYLNARAGRNVIPERVLNRAPSAELRPGQVDQDSLPPYDQLDAILLLHLEEQMGVDGIVERTGYDAELVRAILRRIDRSEFKRRQAPPGLRVTRKAFGTGRRLPVTMGWDRQD